VVLRVIIGILNFLPLAGLGKPIGQEDNFLYYKMKNPNNIFIFIIFLSLFFLSTFSLVFAAVDDYLQVNIPGLTLNLSTASCPTDGTQCNIGWIGQYISAIYQYGVGLAAVLAVVMIMAGGFIWLMSGGSPDKVGVGKDFITAALTGLILALFSFLILQTINPKLVSSPGSVDTSVSSSGVSGGSH